MVAEIGLEREEPKAWRILMMLSFRLKLKLLVYNSTYPSCPDGYRDVWARNDFVSWIVKQFSM